MEISKEQFYNYVVEIYLKTGQGLAGFVTIKTGREPLNELLAEGKVKIFKKHYSYLPDDEWICLTDVYCVEEEEQNGTCPRALDFMRRYLGVKGNSVIDQKIEEYLDKNPKERIKLDNEYNAWLDKNRELLEKSFQKQKVELPDASVKPAIDPKLAEYVKTFGWYKKNEKVNEVLNKVTERISISNQLKKLHSEYIRLSKEQNKIEEHKQEMKDLDNEIELDMKICSILRKSDSKLVQEIFE